MAKINELLEQVEDKALRARLEEEFQRLSKTKKFGLVFEDHIPECTPLYGIGIKVGATVARKAGQIKETFTVVRIDGTVAKCYNKLTRETHDIPLEELVPVAQFGEPIFPMLLPIDSIQNAPESSLWHTLIEADNYHALQLLEYLYAGKVDCIYIDPPYNTGARDWKYNNDYVDGSDSYRHSKWLSMMEKRLKIAKRLLNPNDSVMIITIDEKEYLHLGCMLEELFPAAKMQMISTVINPSGVSRDNEFYRTDEYIFILRFGACIPSRMLLPDEWVTARTTGKDKLRWRRIRRQGSHDTRRDAANQFYPIFITPDGKKYAGAGDSLPIDASKDDVDLPKDLITVWPIKPDGTEGCWQISQQSLEELFQKGYIKITWTKKWGYTPQYLAKGERAKVERGQFPVIGKDQYGTIITEDAVEEAPFVPGTQWRISTHNAREHGAKMLRRIFLDKRFDFPKSLYAVTDVLRFFVQDKPDALVIDFFAGSGTTMHAVNLLNREDAGHRRCIMITNNEVSASEADDLYSKGYQPGDPEWESLGIARYVTWPRTVGSITGRDVMGRPLKGNYIDLEENEFPMSDGFSANVEYFKLGFLDRDRVTLGQQFKEILPLLWLKAGAVGKRPETGGEEPEMLVLPENGFAVLVDETMYASFIRQIKQYDEIKMVFFVTDSDDAFREMSIGLPGRETYQLYRDYIDNFVLGSRRA